MTSLSERTTIEGNTIVRYYVSTATTSDWLSACIVRVRITL